MSKKKRKALTPFDFLVQRLREERSTICTDPVRGIPALEDVIREAEAYAAKLQPLGQVPPPPFPRESGGGSARGTGGHEEPRGLPAPGRV